MMKLGVLISRRGSLLTAIKDHDIPITVVIADRPCPALELAQRWGLKTEIVKREDFSAAFDKVRSTYTRQLIKFLEMHGVEIVAMAGFMTVLTKEFFERYPVVLNCHPAELPRFKGLNAIAETIAARVALTGPTIHLASEELDGGQILAQDKSVHVLKTDTVTTLHERIKEVEYHLYPAIIRCYLERFDPDLPPVADYSI